MAWQTPKTNWIILIYTSSKRFAGNWFNVEDFNRIKNNLQYLYEISHRSIDTSEWADMGVDRTTSDLFYADDWNHILQNIFALCSLVYKNTTTVEYTTFLKYYYSSDGDTQYGSIGHSYFPDELTLNTIESLLLDMHDRLEKRRMFVWNFGDGGDL